MSEKLPQGWEVAELGALGRWRGGGTPSKSVPAYWSNGTVHWVSPKDMKRLMIDSAEDQITLAAVKESAANLIPKDSVLMVTRSGILEHTFPVAINTVEVAVNQDLKAWTPHPGINPLYAAYFLKAEGRTILDNCAKDGTTVASIDFDRLKAYPVRLAPEPEQARIVSKINELFSSIDEGERALQRVRKLVERYRQSVLKAAMTGELTREWRDQHAGELESGEILLNRILEARRKAWEIAELAKVNEKQTGIVRIKNYKEPTVSDDSETDPLPDCWSATHLDQILAVDKDAMKTGPFGSLLNKSEHVSSGIPVLGIENIGTLRFIRGSNIHVTGEKARQLVGYSVHPGDVVISRSGTVGEVCVIPEDIGEARISTNLMKVSLFPKGILPQLLAMQLYSSPSILKQLRELCKGSTRLFLNQAILRRLTFALPPSKEQEQILDVVAKEMSMIDGLSDELLRLQRRATSLRQTILTAAFLGRLVPQHPRDEPADFLLERIAVERTANRKRPTTNRTPTKRAKA